MEYLDVAVSVVLAVIYFLTFVFIAFKKWDVDTGKGSDRFFVCGVILIAVILFLEDALSKL